MNSKNGHDFFEYSDSLFNKALQYYSVPSTIKEKGQLLRKVRSALQRMNAQEKSELNIFTLLLPERYELSPYYQSLPSEMHEKQKALVIRWCLERIKKSPDKFNPINRREV